LTLPRGFGGGGSWCPSCGRKLVWSKDAQDWTCSNKECELGRNNDIRIPLKKSDIGMGLFYLAFFGGILGMFGGDIGTAMLSAMVFIFGNLGLIFVSASQYRTDWDSLKRAYFFLIPIAKFVKRIRFIE
jgi:hypothetical protein